MTSPENATQGIKELSTVKIVVHSISQPMDQSVFRGVSLGIGLAIATPIGSCGFSSSPLSNTFFYPLVNQQFTNVVSVMSAAPVTLPVAPALYDSSALSALPVMPTPPGLTPAASACATPAVSSTTVIPEPSTLSPLGILRVSNQTYHPIRIALLPRLDHPTDAIVPVIADPSDISIPNKPLTLPFEPLEVAQYGDPIHWDFVPREGHEQGLVLALPEGQFQVHPGDIVTAFAQDGSRRYWGPYMVGVTESPIWDETTGEWTLILQTPFHF